MAAGVNRTLEGSPGPLSAFEDLVREHQRMIHALCYRMTGSLADAEDLAQETFIRAYHHWEDFRGDAQISSWLYRIALNQCLNWRKRTARREQLHREWSQDGPAAGEQVPRRSEQIQDALLKLSPEQRAAVVLTTYDGLSHAEVARVLGCAETTVSWRLFAARRILKQQLEKLDKSCGSL